MNKYVNGRWKKYNQGDSANKLVTSLNGKKIDGLSLDYTDTQLQLDKGDIYVYYTKDVKDDEQPKFFIEFDKGNIYVYYTKDVKGDEDTKVDEQPKIFIEMNGHNNIDDIKVVSGYNDLEPDMLEILKEKLSEFDNAKDYDKKIDDMNKLNKIYNEYKDRELEVEELKFLYQIDNEIDGFDYAFYVSRIKEILKNRNYKKDLSKILGLSPELISNNKQDILDGKKIAYFYGNLDFDDLETVDTLVLPSVVNGSLSMKRLKKIENLVLPKIVEGNVNFLSLKVAESVVFPENIKGSLNLLSLIEADGSVLSKNIEGSLYLDSLERAESVTFPEKIGGILKIPNLLTLEGITIPNDFKYKILDSSYITMDELENKSLEDSNKICLINQRGYAYVILLGIINILVSIGIIVLGMSMLN